MNAQPHFESIIESYYAEIFAYLWRMLQNTEDTEDCIQEAFIRAYKAYHRLDENANYRAWLYKIATNVARSHFRRERGRKLSQNLDETIPSTNPTPVEQFEQSSLIKAVSKAVEGLPYKQRAAIMMRKYQEMSYQEISEVLDCSEEAARANVYQAVKKLRELFPASTQSI